jgi:O-antigen ligase
MMSEKPIKYNVIPFLFILLLLATILPNTPVSTFVGYLMTVGAYAVFIMYMTSKGKTTLRLHKVAVLCLIPIYGLFGYWLIADPLSSSLITSAIVVAPAFLFTSFLNIFYIPRIVPLQSFLWAVTRVSILIIFVGGVAFLLRPVVILFDPLHPKSLFWLADSTFNSIFTNPNQLGRLLSVGLVASVVLCRRRPNRVSVSVIPLIIAGLFLTGSRSGLLAGAVGTSIYLLHAVRSRNAALAIAAVGSVTAMVVFAILFGIVPGPAVLTDLDLRNRVELWVSTYHAITNAPIAGYGFENTGIILSEFLPDPRGVHNSFLRIFLITGIPGGVAYLCLFGFALVRGFRQASESAAVVLGLGFTVICSHIFDSFMIFGLRSGSVLSALILGYIYSDRL